MLEVGFTVLADADPPPAYVIWAAVLKNTSQTDLLAYARLELAWRAGESTAENVDYWAGSQLPWIYDILPGKTAIIGGQVNIRDRLTPESLDISVHTEWYPMWALEARGDPVGVEVTGFDIDTSDLDAGGRVGVRVDYTSWYESEPLTISDDDFRLLLVMRDAGGSLLGALQAAEFGVWAPGQLRQSGSILASQWLDEADADASEAAITRVCCGRLGG